MSETNQFDNFIKNELGDLTPRVSPGMWDKIIAERERRRPGGFWLSFLNSKGLLLISGLLVTGIVGTSLILSRDNKGATQKLISATESAQVIDIVSNKKSAVQEIDRKGFDDGKHNSEVVRAGISTDVNPVAYMAPAIVKKVDSDMQNPGDKYISPVAADEILKTNEENAGNIIALNEEFMPHTQATKTKVQQNIVDRFSMDGLRAKLIPKVYLPDCPEIEKDAAANKKYIEVYAGPDIIFRNFSDTSNSVYLQKRKESTKVVSAFSAGFRYAKIFKNGMGIKAGVNFSQINERFSFIQSNLVQITYIIDPLTGDTTGSYTVTGTRKKITNNRYRFVDVPLLIGYELGNGRFHANISAGAMINIYSWQRGDVLDTTYQPVNISTGKISSPYQFRSNIGVSLAGGVAMYYKLTNTVHVMAEPYFRYSLNPMSKDALSFKQKYNTLGLHVGVRLDLQ